MRISLIKVIRNSTLILGVSLLVTGCQQFSEKEIDQSAGLNGSFEISKNDLPVNWDLMSNRVLQLVDEALPVSQTNSLIL